MDSHSAEAARNGFDVVWWTDHAELYGTFADLRFDFSAAVLDSAAGAVVFRGARLGRQLSGFEVEGRGGARAELAAGRLVLTADAGGARGAAGGAGGAGAPPEEATVRISPGSKLGKVHTINFCRPVTSGLKLDAWLRADGLGPDTYVRVGFDLAWHPGGQHHLIFEGVEGGGRAPRLVGDTTVVTEFEVPRRAARATFDLEKAASLLPRGADNTLSGFYIEAGARGRQALRVEIDSLVLGSDKPDGRFQVGAVDSLARVYSAAYGLREYVGIEIGKMHTAASPHMNAYYPDEGVGYQRLDIETRGPRRNWVDAVHRKGGLVSFNHPFGAHRSARQLGAGPGDAAGGEPAVAPGGAEAPDGDGAEEYDSAPPGFVPRALARKGPAVSEDDFWEVAEPLLDGDGLGADMLEVGYLFRGRGSLDDHLRLWDLALAHGIRLVGTGTSDSHGGVWGPDMVPNPFATWVWSAGAGAADLLAAVKRGRAAFGDPFLWKSALAFTVDGEDGLSAMMGDTLYVSGGSRARGRLEITPARDDVDVRMVRVKLKKARQVDRTTETLKVAAGVSNFPVAVDGACYVRLEIYAKDGTPLIFTNPIFLFPRN